MEIARYVAARTKAGKLVSVAGGGDTVAALNMAGVADDFTYVSTAGGAFLEWMEGKPLPGVEVLRQKGRRNRQSGAFWRTALHSPGIRDRGDGDESRRTE